MSAFWGMDTGLVRNHSERLRTASEEVDDLRSQLETTVRAAGWAGPDAEEFRTRWDELSATAWVPLGSELTALGDRGAGEADQQDSASAPGGGTGPDGVGSALPPGTTAELDRGYRREDSPWLPDWLEAPLETGLSELAGTASDMIGRGVDGALDALEGGLGAVGVNTAGIAQFQRDAEHLGGILEDWTTGERVPTYAELGAAALVTAGSAGVGVYEAATGEDTAFLDDRPGGIVHGVQSDPTLGQSPQDLGDLLIRNDSLRMANPGGPLEAGQIGIQEIRSADGGDPAYIVQVPPTEGAPPTSFPGAYGEQGNSRDWGSNLRLVAGQHPAAMDDVRAAMDAADVPPGSDVLLVGHSQGGIVTSHLAADPAFNSDSGAAGTFNVTHSFSAGAPVQTVVPSQDSTEVVNVAHGPVGLDPHVVTGGVSTDIGYTGDPIAQLDLQGAQVGGGSLETPNVHEVVLPGSPGLLSEGTTPLFDNHDSYSANDPGYGYYGSVQEGAASGPVLSALQDELSGVYLGDGTEVIDSHVVTVGRGEP